LTRDVVEISYKYSRCCARALVIVVIEACARKCIATPPRKGHINRLPIPYEAGALLVVQCLQRGQLRITTSYFSSILICQLCRQNHPSTMRCPPELRVLKSPIVSLQKLCSAYRMLDLYVPYTNYGSQLTCSSFISQHAPTNSPTSPS